MAITMNKKDEMAMRLVHYFITEENYSPIVVNGVVDEIWLQNTSAPYKIIRINSNTILNDEQFNYDVLKIENVVRQVKKRTLSWHMNTLNILLDLNEEIQVPNLRNINTITLKRNAPIKDQSMLKFFPDINDKLLKSEGFNLMFEVTNDINVKTEKENKVYESIFKPKKIVITNVLITINVILFFIMFGLSGTNITGNTLVAFGGCYGPLIKNGEIYRLITGGFLHANLMHLIFNMYALYLIGTQMESFMGKKKYLALYLFSLMSSSLLSVIMNPNTVSVGASGAIFGLTGALIYFGYHYRLYLSSVLKTQIIPIVALNFLLGFMIPGIDIYGHIGGFIGGILLSMALGVQKNESKTEMINGLVCSGIYLLFLIYLVFWR